MAITWKDFYDEYYDMSYVNKVHYINGMTRFDSNEELIEVITDLYYDKYNELANKLLFRAFDYGVWLSGAELVELPFSWESDDFKKAVRACEDRFTRDDVDEVALGMGDEWCEYICKKNSIPTDDELFGDDEEDFIEEEYIPEPRRKKEPGLLWAILGGMLIGDLLDSIFSKKE